MVLWIPLFLRLEPSSFLKSALRRFYNHESRRDGNCCGNVFLRERGGAVADGRSGWCAEQQRDIGASWPDDSARIGKRFGIDVGAGAERPGGWVIGEGTGVQRAVKVARRSE